MQENLKPYQIMADNAALDFLRPGTKERATKMDAYCSLLAKAVAEDRDEVSLFGTTVRLKKGQFPVTMSDLAKEWNWHRVTTREFFDDLEKLRLAQVTPYGKFFVVTMNYRDLSDRHNQPHLQSEAEQRLTRWICGYISLEELVQGCVEFFKDTDDLFAPIVAEGQRVEVGERLHKLVSHLILQHTELIPSQDEVTEALDTLFTRFCDQDLTKFWAMLASYGMKSLFSPLPTDEPTDMLASVSVPSEAEPMLSVVACYYLPFLRAHAALAEQTDKTVLPDEKKRL